MSIFDLIDDSYSEHILTIAIKQTKVIDTYFWRCLSTNKHITYNTILKHSEMAWDYTLIVQSSKIKLDIIENYYKRWSNLYFWLSANPNITVKFVEDHTDIGWNWEQLSYNLKFNGNIDFFMKHKDKFNYRNLSYNPSIIDVFVLYTPHKDWNFSLLSKNKNLTLKCINTLMNEPWCWYILSSHPHITREFVEKNLDKRWCWFLLEKYKKLFWCPDNSVREVNEDDIPLCQKNSINYRVYNDKEIFSMNILRKDFMKEDGLAQELLSVVWHPDNFYKFKDLDP